MPAVLKELLNWGKIRNKFLIVTLAIGIIPLIILAVVSFEVSSMASLTRSSEIISTNLSMANNLLETQCGVIEMMARRILSNRTIYIEMTAGADGLGLNYPNAEAAQRIDAVVRQLSVNNTAISSVTLLGWDGFRYRYRRSQGASGPSIELADYAGEEWYRRTMLSDGYECYFLYDVLSEDRDHDDRYAASITKLLRDLDTNEPYGILVINVHKGYYNNIYPAAIREDNSCYLIADTNSGRAKYITYSLGDEERMNGAVQDYLARGDPGSHFLTTAHHNRRTGWSLVHIVEKSSFLSYNRAIFLVTFLVMILLIVFCVFVSVSSARTITKPLTMLGEAIRVMEADGAVSDAVFGDDEVGRIGRRFQKLAAHNEMLNQKIIKLSLLEREAEFNALQAQINPHFLYNTLSSIYWLCKFGKADAAAEIAVDLSDMFRLVLNKGGDIVTVEQEIRHIKRYLNIQNVRYNNRIETKWSVDPAMLDKFMLKLILQPLVENAIYHGLEPKTGEWSLTVEGRMEGGDMLFQITDNGVGMDTGHAPATGYGIRNVSERIKLKYGQEYGCVFESAAGEGTRVTIRIPCEEGGNRS